MSGSESGANISNCTTPGCKSITIRENHISTLNLTTDDDGYGITDDAVQAYEGMTECDQCGTVYDEKLFRCPACQYCPSCG